MGHPPFDDRSRIIRRRFGRSRETRSRGRPAAGIPPGTDYKYWNTEYTLLGLIIERVTGRSWRHEVTRRVIGPLGLSRT